MAQIIYVLTNQAMPGLVKIGRTTDSIDTRMRQLHSTGVPKAFDCHFAAEVENCEELERKLHRLFADVRYKPNREFFEVDPAKVVLAIGIGSFTDITPHRAETITIGTEHTTHAVNKLGKSRFSLRQVGVNVGDVLILSRDESISCTVESDNRVRFNDEIMSLAKAGEKALHSLGFKAPLPFQEYWKFEGKTLAERYASSFSQLFETNQSEQNGREQKS